MKNTIILSACLLLMTGCSSVTTSECDPAIEHKTITNAGCLFSGKYGERQENLKLTTEEEREINESLTQIHTLLVEERMGVSKNLASTQEQYRKLDRSLNKLISQISSRSSGNEALQLRIAKLQAKKDKVINNHSTSGARKQLELNSLYTEVESLKKELGYQ